MSGSKPQLRAIPQRKQQHDAWISPRHDLRLFASVALGLLLIMVLSVAIGSVYIPPLTILKLLLAQIWPTSDTWPAAYGPILLQIRLPRVALVALTGAALACSGGAYQGLFRNPLADPYLIGVAPGAGLGAISALSLQVIYPGLGILMVPLCAFAGALITVMVVYALGRASRSTPTTLLLAGVAVGSLATACSTLLLLRVGQQAARVLSFLLGGYGSAGWNAVVIVAAFTLIGTIALCIHARPLNLLLFDSDQAQHLGVHVERVTLAVVLAATLMTAAAVAFSGLIGFVGLIVPHAARLLVGADHRRLIPMSTLGGAGFLVLADICARTLLTPEELPVGVITAFIGAPFFLWLLYRTRAHTEIST